MSFPLSLVRFTISFLLLLFTQKSLGLLDASGKGSAEDRKDLKLLYTFSESNTQNTVYNQVYKNDLNHPSHLTFFGKRANAELDPTRGLVFKNNSIMSSRDQAYIRTQLGKTYQKELVSLEGKKQRGQSSIPERVYLKSKGDLSMNSMCGSNSELTVQVFYRPDNANYSNGLAHLLNLRPTNNEKSSFRISQKAGGVTLLSSMGSISLNHRAKDVNISGELNETVLSFSSDHGATAYHLLHGESGKEGWLSVDEIRSGQTVTNFPNSRFIIGAGYFPNGENVSQILSQMQNETTESALKTLLAHNTSGFVGEIKQIAVYCRYTEQAEVLGGEYIDTSKIKVTPALNQDPTQSQKVAARLLSLITKKKIPIDAKIVQEAAHLIAQGEYKKAALIGVNLPGFYNNTVKDFALKMSNREETNDVPLNDFAATTIGFVRDQLDARELLTANFYYRGDPYVGVPSDQFNHFLKTNIHYEELEKKGVDLSKALVKVGPQKIIGPGSKVVSHPDPAGVLTSRAFLSAHAEAGTNRRQVEYAFKQFMCVNLSDMADTEASDLRVGRDIDRFPGNSHKKYQTSCKGCHSVMDGFRGAFAKTDFNAADPFVKYADFFTINTKRVGKSNIRYPASISYKVNHNEFSYPKGYVTTDDSFYNFANRGANALLFGWRSEVNKGYGMRQFGDMLSKSERFSKCMVKRVFEAICPININETTLAQLQLYVSDFEKTNYDLKNLFLNAAISPLCLGNN